LKAYALTTNIHHHIEIGLLIICYRYQFIVPKFTIEISTVPLKTPVAGKGLEFKDLERPFLLYK